MRRLALLVAVGATWLFLAALPVLADGGPHVASVNNGVSSLTADSCAGCHRVHTANGPMLLQATSEEELCLSCHGAASTGASTDVETGIQYVPAANGTRTATQLGALRGGGFDQARIDSATPARSRYGTGMTDFYAKVRVGAATDVTSAHIALPENGLTMPGVAWGNGANGSGVGPAATVSCGSCHNPHGNTRYRILNTIPSPEVTAGTFVPVASPGVPVLDSPVDNPDPAERDTKNYTVIQVRGTQGNNNSFLLYADDVLDLGYGSTTGDYWHRTTPWFTAPSGSAGLDAPNGQPSSFNLQMSNWCLACHTRYYSTDPNSERVDPISGLPDTVFRYQHQTTTNNQTVCTTCHVSHGSNAAMAGAYAGSFPYPDDPAAAPAATLSGSSRLLKIDGRGTCQACHDPTDTVGVGSYTGPLPTPGAP